MRIFTRLLSWLLLMGLGVVGLLSVGRSKQDQPEHFHPGPTDTGLAHPSSQDS
jgi:hypothetical protein